MQIFIDSADIGEIREAAEPGLGADRERLVGVPAARAGAAPLTRLAPHRAPAARTDEQVLVDQRVEGEHPERLGPTAVPVADPARVRAPTVAEVRGAPAPSLEATATRHPSRARP